MDKSFIKHCTKLDSVCFLSDDRESVLDQAVDLLDPDLRPIPPQPNCQESMQIYDEHRLVRMIVFLTISNFKLE